MPQRLVRWHPGSQRHSLYLSSHIGRIQGWPVPAGTTEVGPWLIAPGLVRSGRSGWGARPSNRSSQ